MKKVFTVTPSNYGYAEYYRLIIVAKNNDEALALVIANDLIENHQFPITIEEIDLTKSDIIGMEGLDV